MRIESTFADDTNRNTKYSENGYIRGWRDRQQQADDEYGGELQREC
jgi:hypothetical protein